MSTSETFTKFGKFQISSEEQLWGELRVDGTNSLLYVRDDEKFNPYVPADGCITGVLHDLIKVTLLGCINLTSELMLVLDEAVSCRNHYVHGTPSRIEYSKNFDLVIFFTNTLEFVFGASELIEAGWDIRRFAERGTTMTHPYGSYLVGYERNLEDLKSLLSV